MSAFVPPQGSGSAIPAQGAPRTGKHGKSPAAGPAGFADALFSLVPFGKKPDAGNRSVTIVRVDIPHRTESKAAERDIRRKERTGKEHRESAPASHGTAIALLPSAARGVSAVASPGPTAKKRPAAASEGNIPTPVPLAPAIAAPAVSGVAAPRPERIPSPIDPPAVPSAARAAARSREKAPSSRHGDSKVSRRADAPSGSPDKSTGKRLEGEMGSSPVSPSPDPDPPAADGRMETSRRKNPPAEAFRENLAGPGALSRPAAMDPGGSEKRQAGTETLPGGIAPPPASRRKAGSGRTAAARGEVPAKGSGPASPGPERAAPAPGKRDPAAPAAPSRTTMQPRSEAADGVDRRPAGPGDPGGGVSFAGLAAPPPAIEPDMAGVAVPSPAAPAASVPGAPLPAPLFEQVAMKMTPLADGAHDVEIRLVPEHLGKLRIELHVDSGRVDASLHADNPEARALLLREEPALREALRNAGVTLSSFNVALSGEPWKERREGTRPNGDADSAPRRGGKEEKAEGVVSVHREDVERGGMSRTEHWIA